MARYVARRLLLAIPVLVVVSIVVFGGVRVIPGNICYLVLQNTNVDPAQCAALEHRLGLDKPPVTQYLAWAAGVLHGNLGTSLTTNQSVWGQILSRLPATLELVVLAAVFSLALALPIGIYSALKRDRFADYVLRLLTIGWLSLPGFWVATLLVTFPAKWWGYSPPIGWVPFWQDPLTNLQQMYMPAFALGLALCASLARLMRSSMLEVLNQDYIRVARSKGLRDHAVMYRHALKNAMLPVVTLFGLQIGFLFGGTVVLESIFSLPGLGSLLLDSVLMKDYTQLQGIVLLFAAVIVVTNLLVDLSYAWFDPRLRYA